MRRVLSIAAWIFFAVCCDAQAASNQPVKQIPAFQLADPTGAKHTQAEVFERGSVLILTIPNVKHAPVQDRWARMITAGGWNKNGPRLVFIEDMSQSAVKEKSMESLKARFVAGKNPLILIDPDGTMRGKLGIMDDETVVFVIDKKGQTVLFAEGPPEDDQVTKILDAVKKL